MLASCQSLSWTKQNHTFRFFVSPHGMILDVCINNSDGMR